MENHIKRFRVCYKCDHRSVGCHATCKEYSDEVQRNNDMLNQKRADGIEYGYVYDSITRMYRRKRNRH